MRRMIAAGALILCACQSKEPPPVDVVTAPPPQKSRSEVVLYNGRNYTMAFTVSGNVFHVKVSGLTRVMKANEKQDAVNITTSGVRYFGCRDKQMAEVLGAPRFAGETWSLQARCVAV